jgi:hypothetical protein
MDNKYGWLSKHGGKDRHVLCTSVLPQPTVFLTAFESSMLILLGQRTSLQHKVYLYLLYQKYIVLSV